MEHGADPVRMAEVLMTGASSIGGRIGPPWSLLVSDGAAMQQPVAEILPRLPDAPVRPARHLVHEVYTHDAQVAETKSKTKCA